MHTCPIKHSVKHFGSERRNELIFRYTVLMSTSLWPGEQGPHSTRVINEEGPRESIVHAWRWPTNNPDNQPRTTTKEQQPTNISQPAVSSNFSLCTMFIRTWNSKADPCRNLPHADISTHVIGLTHACVGKLRHFKFIQLFSASQGFQMIPMIHAESRSCSCTDDFLFINP